MMIRIAGTLVFTLSFCCAGFAQSWEIGGAGGFSAPRSLDVSNGNANGKASFTNGVTFGAVLGQRLYNRFSGEARYTYRAGDLKLTGNGQEAKLGGDAHVMHYDLLIHATKPEAVVRPYAAVGGGAEIFRGTSAPPVFQPLNNLAVLTQTWQAEPLISLGGGVKFALGQRAIFRLDFRDYATPVPDKLFAARAGSKLNGWMHDFVFLVGISYAFRVAPY